MDIFCDISTNQDFFLRARVSSLRSLVTNIQSPTGKNYREVFLENRNRKSAFQLSLILEIKPTAEKIELIG